MAMMNREGYEDAGRQRAEEARRAAEAAIPNTPDAAAPAGEQPPSPDAGGSAPPPPDAGDAPDRQFPVPPVPPPPSPGPIFSLAGGGGGGAASFARPGTAAAKPFRSQLFSTNRSTAPGVGAAPRFGAGTAVAGGATPFLPAGLDAGGEASAGGDDEELKRILAIIQGGRG